jgi:hypothetical protein
MVVAANPEAKDSARMLWQEARELVLILSAIHRKAAKSAK